MPAGHDARQFLSSRGGPVCPEAGLTVLRPLSIHTGDSDAFPLGEGAGGGARACAERGGTGVGIPGLGTTGAAMAVGGGVGPGVGKVAVEGVVGREPPRNHANKRVRCLFTIPQSLEDESLISDLENEIRNRKS